MKVYIVILLFVLMIDFTFAQGVGSFACNSNGQCWTWCDNGEGWCFTGSRCEFVEQCDSNAQCMKPRFCNRDWSRNDIVCRHTEALINDNKSEVQKNLLPLENEFQSKWQEQIPLASKPPQKKYAWIKSDANTYIFRSDNDIWIERDADSFIHATFEQIEEKADEVVLFDKSRNMFVKLTDDAAAFGSSRENITVVLTYGRWLARNELVEVRDKELWKKKDVDEYFFKTDGEVWLEKHDGNIVNSFVQLAETKDAVVLYDESRSMSIKLTPQDGLWGRGKNKIEYYFTDGKWMANFKISSN
jgi:hypothetical protein